MENRWQFKILQEKFSLVLKLSKFQFFSPFSFVKFNYGQKLYFFNFMAPSLRENREGVDGFQWKKEKKINRRQF